MLLRICPVLVFASVYRLGLQMATANPLSKAGKDAVN
jgi:hypothetical protein